MNFHNLLSDLPDASRPVRITVTARQTGLNAPFGIGGEPSLFGTRPPAVPPRPESGPVTPENAPEALDYAVDDIIDRDSDGYGFGPEEAESDADYPPEDGPADIWEVLENVLRSLGEPEEDDSIVIHTLGRMEKRILPGGYLELSIRYDEENPDDPGENAETVVTLNSREPDMLTVSRHGSVTSMIVCEEGVRHVTAYGTPFGTLELAVLAKQVSSSVTFAHGGVASADYLVEFHGSDLQYSQLRVEVEVLP
jgi:uncharacterized beta-barrel protein YwiB (DUF1934 family)